MAQKEGYYGPEEHWRSGGYYHGQAYGYPGGHYYGSPCSRYSYDQKEGRYMMEFELPGFDRKEISLDMWGENFCLWAKKDDTQYSGCYMFPHYVDPEKAQAWYENGVLKVYAPLKDWEKRKHIDIQ